MYFFEKISKYGWFVSINETKELNKTKLPIP